MRFRKMSQTCAVSRQTTTVDGGYSKTAFVSTGNSYPCLSKALSLSSGIEIGSFGRDFEMHTVANADIRESDRLTIDGQLFDVKGVSKYSGLTFSSLHCVLTRTENAT